MKQFFVSLLVSGTTSVVVMSALVVAQVPKADPGQAAMTVEKARRAPRDAVDKQVDARKARVLVAQAANLENVIIQFTHQGRPLVRAELIFAREVCQLNVEQFRRINQDAEAALKDMATKMAEGQQGRVMLPGQVRVRPNNPGGRPPDGVALLRDGLGAVMKKHLTADQFSRYQSELEKRNVNRKTAAVHFLVDAIDRDLYLSDQQRARLTESLRLHWDDSWTAGLEYLLYGNQFFPAGVDPFVTPYLDAPQRKVWQGTQKVGGISNLGGVWGGFMNDNDALEIELGELKKPGPARKGATIRKGNVQDQEITGKAATKK